MKSRTFDYLKSLIDSTTSHSSGRFAFLLTIIISNISVWGTWIVVCLATSTVHDIPAGVAAIYGLANGIAFTGKVAAKSVENKDCEEKKE